MGKTVNIPLLIGVSGRIGDLLIKQYKSRRKLLINVGSNSIRLMNLFNPNPTHRDSPSPIDVNSPQEPGS